MFSTFIFARYTYMIFAYLKINYWTTFSFCKPCSNVKSDHEDIFLRDVYHWLDNKINHSCLLAFTCKLI